MVKIYQQSKVSNGWSMVYKAMVNRSWESNATSRWPATGIIICWHPWSSENWRSWMSMSMVVSKFQTAKKTIWIIWTTNPSSNRITKNCFFCRQHQWCFDCHWLLGKISISIVGPMGMRQNWKPTETQMLVFFVLLHPFGDDNLDPYPHNGYIATIYSL